MAANDLSDSYVIATFALWAGDFAYAETLLKQVTRRDVAPRTEEAAESPEDLLRAIAMLRLRQLRQKRGEFRKLVQGQPSVREITDQPTVIETDHLRATVWRSDAREFVLQGYLKDLAWEEKLFQHAREQANLHQVLLPPSSARNGEEFHGARAESTEPSVAWVIGGNPFLQATLTDMGLLEVTAVWTNVNLPAHINAIIHPFEKLLHALDHRQVTG